MTDSKYQSDLTPIDPSEMFKPVIPVSLTPTQQPATAPVEPHPQSQVTSSAAEPEKAPDILDKALPDDLVSRLGMKFGILEEHIVDTSVIGGGKEIKISLRPSTYDDLLWATGVVEESVQEKRTTGTIQMRQYVAHLSAAASVIKIEDEFVWDAFGLTSGIKESEPAWDGKSYTNIPAEFQNMLAEQVYDLFRRLHPDILFSLDKALKQAFKDEDKDETKDPTEAA